MFFVKKILMMLKKSYLHDRCFGQIKILQLNRLKMFKKRMINIVKMHCYTMYTRKCIEIFTNSNLYLYNAQYFFPHGKNYKN